MKIRLLEFVIKMDEKLNEPLCVFKISPITEIESLNQYYFSENKYLILNYLISQEIINYFISDPEKIKEIDLKEFKLSNYNNEFYHNSYYDKLNLDTDLFELKIYKNDETLKINCELEDLDENLHFLPKIANSIFEKLNSLNFCETNESESFISIKYSIFEENFFFNYFGITKDSALKNIYYALNRKLNLDNEETRILATTILNNGNYFGKKILFKELKNFSFLNLIQKNSTNNNIILEITTQPIITTIGNTNLIDSSKLFILKWEHNKEVIDFFENNPKQPKSINMSHFREIKRYNLGDQCIYEYNHLNLI